MHHNCSHCEEMGQNVVFHTNSVKVTISGWKLRENSGVSGFSKKVKRTNLVLNKNGRERKQRVFK